MDNVLTFPIIPRRRIIGQGIGEYPGQRKGQGHDFIEKRPYRTSDSLGDIDWKETAKRSAQRRVFSPQVRQFRRDEIVKAVIVVDRSVRMSWYPPPWLSKSQVIVTAGQMIVDSLKKAHGLIGYLDYAEWAKDSMPFWRPPNHETEADRVRNRNLLYGKFRAPEDNISMALEWLLALRTQVPPESFVFLLSDFLVMPKYDLIETAAARWNLVPIIIQDPLLEASYPVWRGKIPVWLPEVSQDGRRQSSLLSGAAAQEKRINHQNRIRDIIRIFEALGLYPISLFNADPEQIYHSFLRWSAIRAGSGF